MTIRFKYPWNGLDGVQALGTTEEARLVGLGVAAYYTAEVSPPDTFSEVNASLAALGARVDRVLGAGTLYIDLMTSFGRSGYGTPSGLTSYPTINDAGSYEITGFRVTGDAGATALTLASGTVADIGGIWSGAIEHADGIWRTYTVKNATGATLDVFPPLEASVTRARLVNVQDAASGQHLTESGSFALADYLYDFNPLFANRQEYYYRIAATDASGWELYNGLNGGRLSHNQAGNVYASFTKSTQMVRRKTRSHLMAGNTNQGVNKVWDITGKVGYFETTLSVQDAAVPARVDVLIDGYVVYRKDTYGFELIRVPFGGAATLECRIYSLALQTSSTHIGDTTLWKAPTQVPAHVFAQGERVVWLGDSWTYRQAAAIQRRLQQRGAERGITVIPIGAPGQQATWAIGNFSKVSAAQPTAVVIEYFVNDLNSLTESGVATWVSRMQQLVALVAGIGARPIVLMGAPTGSEVQSQSLANWSAQLAEGTLAA